MKGTKHISEVFIEMAASNSDPLGRLLRRLPFIQAELLKRKIITLWLLLRRMRLLVSNRWSWTSLFLLASMVWDCRGEI